MGTKSIISLIRNDCDAELTEVNAVIDGALDAVAALTQSEIAAVRGVKTPSVCLKLIMEAICLLKNLKPDRVPDTAAGGSKMIGMVSHKMSLITIFGHKYFRQKFSSKI